MRRKGISLIEGVVMTTALAAILLAMFVAVRYGINRSREAKEADLRLTLTQLNTGTDHFKIDLGGYPSELRHLLQVPPAGALGGGRVLLNLDGWKGPYLVTKDGQIPPDPMTGKADWQYNATNGRVRSSSTTKSLDGSRYYDW